MRRVLAVVSVLVSALPARAPAAGLDLIPPVDGPIVRHFEPPPDPYGPGHRGLDFAAPEGTDVVASAPGSVAFAGQVGGRLFVSLDHDGGLRTTYSFLSAVLVDEGDAVAQGDLIALSGLGHSDGDGPHLHFGLRRADEYLDPEPLLIEAMRRNLWRIVHLAPVDPA